MEPSLEACAESCESMMQRVYLRLSYEDFNVNLHHPLETLLLWGGHVNIQRVTNDAWSNCLLKFTMKCERKVKP
jgi:hypothetical protein